MISALRAIALNHLIGGACVAIGFTPVVAAYAQTQQQNDFCVHVPADASIPYSPNAQIGRCTAAIQSGRLSGNDLAQAFYKRGIAYLNTRAHNLAIAEFTEAIRRNSQYWPAYTERALIYLDKHEFHHAIVDYNEAIRLYPGSSNYYSRAKAYYAKGDYERAIADYTEALRRSSDFGGIGTRLAMPGGVLTVTSLIDGGGAASAGVQANDIITAVDAIPVKGFLRDEVLAKLRGPPGSQVKLTISRKGEPQPLELMVTRQLIHLEQSENASVLTERGRAYFAMHDYERAMADYNRAIEINPKEARAYYNRGQAKRVRGDPVGGEVDLVQARQLDPEIGKAASSSYPVR